MAGLERGLHIGIVGVEIEDLGDPSTGVATRASTIATAAGGTLTWSTSIWSTSIWSTSTWSTSTWSTSTRSTAAEVDIADIEALVAQTFGELDERVLHLRLALFVQASTAEGDVLETFAALLTGLGDLG